MGVFTEVWEYVSLTLFLVPGTIFLLLCYLIQLDDLVNCLVLLHLVKPCLIDEFWKSLPPPFFEGRQKSTESVGGGKGWELGGVDGGNPGVRMYCIKEE